MAGKIAFVDSRKCDPRQCEKGVCTAALACPRKLMSQEEDYEVPMADTGPCRGCGDCVRSCPLGAVQLMSG